MEYLIYLYVLIGFIVLIVAFVGYTIIKENKRSVTLGGDPQYRRFHWLRRVFKKRKRRKRRR